MMWTNGIDDKWYTDAEMTAEAWREIDGNPQASDAFGQWVNEEFATPWDAADWCEVKHLGGEDPMTSLFCEWVRTMLETDRRAITELFGYDEWEGER